jgi:uncharacterized surface anchored protein
MFTRTRLAAATLIVTGAVAIGSSASATFDFPHPTYPTTTMATTTTEPQGDPEPTTTTSSTTTTIATTTTAGSTTTVCEDCTPGQQTVPTTPPTAVDCGDCGRTTTTASTTTTTRATTTTAPTTTQPATTTSQPGTTTTAAAQAVAVIEQPETLPVTGSGWAVFLVIVGLLGVAVGTFIAIGVRHSR